MLTIVPVKEGPDRKPISIRIKDKEYVVISAQFEESTDVGERRGMQLTPCKCKVKVKNNIVSLYLYLSGGNWYMYEKAGKKPTRYLG